MFGDWRGAAKEGLHSGGVGSRPDRYCGRPVQLRPTKKDGPRLVSPAPSLAVYNHYGITQGFPDRVR
eukprot:3649822-Alexandrium_andersonii.AAC.1